MKTIIASLMLALVAITASAQANRNAIPSPDDYKKLTGLTYWLADNAPRFGVYQKFVGEGEIITLNDTNFVMLLRSDGELTNCFVNFPNPTNNPNRMFNVVSVGNVGITLSNTLGSTFTSITNVEGSIYVMNTNLSANVYSTGTNWIVIPGNK
jgi:hypothetical protein